MTPASQGLMVQGGSHKSAKRLAARDGPGGEEGHTDRRDRVRCTPTTARVGRTVGRAIAVESDG